MFVVVVMANSFFPYLDTQILCTTKFLIIGIEGRFKVYLMLRDMEIELAREKIK